MANALHVAKLRDGARAWNAWRAEQPDIVPDLSHLELPIGLKQFGPAQGGPIDLHGADLDAAMLEQATLIGAGLVKASLVGADLSHARLENADLSGADLRGADLGEAELRGARLDGANLSGAQLRDARNLTQAQVEGASGDATTVLPGDLEPPRAWLRPSRLAKVQRRGSDRVLLANGDPHAILGVGRRASTREIRAAYLRLVKELHPDGRAPDPTAHDADEQLKLINEAYQELKGFGGRATARRAERRSFARRAGTIFLVGMLTSGAPALVVLAGLYYAGWFGPQETRPGTAGKQGGESVAVRTTKPESAPGKAEPASERTKNASAARETAWAEAQKQATREAWERYVAAYPDDEHAAEARQALAAIERAEARRREERAAWAAAEKGAKEELQRFVETYPDAEDVARARQAIAALERAEARRREELAAWNAAEKGAKEDLARFLATYPDSEHAIEARQALAAIGRAEARQSEERAAWGAAERSGDKAELQRFVETYPDSGHVAQAREAIAAIAAAEARLEADHAAWEDAERNGGKAALRQYLADFPSGTFAAKAQERVALLETEEAERDDTAWLKAARRNSKAAYASYLTAYPNGRRAVDARTRIADLERAEERLAPEPAKAPPARPRAPEAVAGQKWQADEPFIGADGRIRR